MTLSIQHSKRYLIEQLEKVGNEQSSPERQCDGRRKQVKETHGSEWAAPTACKKLSFLFHWFGQDFSHWGESFQLNLYYFLCPQYGNVGKTEQNLRHILKLWPHVCNPTTSSGTIPTENKRNGISAACQHLFSNKSVTLFPLPPNLISHKSLIANNKQ